jgi:L-alanine-DL-glutamate epimerase-like enolase superfamily enzyme
MRITGISDIVVPISSAIRNAYIDFSQMTASVVAIHTDVVRDGKPVVGFGFNSNGRYAPQGLLRERFIPRLNSAKPEEIVDAHGMLDPAKCWDAMMKNEKPGGHGERSVAVGVLDMALWDALAKAEGVPLRRLLADRYNNGKTDDTAWVYAAGGYYYPDKDIAALTDEMKRYLDLGYSCVKMKIGGVPLKDDIKRIEAVLKSARATTSASTSTAATISTRLWPAAMPSRRIICAGTRSRSIRSIICCTRRWRRVMRHRSPPARTCSPCRMRAI